MHVSIKSCCPLANSHRLFDSQLTEFVGWSSYDGLDWLHLESACNLAKASFNNIDQNLRHYVSMPEMESATANRSLPPWSALLSSWQHAFVLGWQRCLLSVCGTSDTPYSREILYVILSFRWKRHTKNLSVDFPFDVCRGGVQKLWCGHRLHPTMYQALVHFAQCG